jgi:hypothetical protein
MTISRGALTRLVAYAVGAAGLVMLLLAARSFLGSSGFAYDYMAYDSAARRIAAGLALYPPGTAEAYNSGSYAGLYLYPPPLAVGLVPLTLFDSSTAAQTWLWLRIALLIAAAAILPASVLVRASVLAVASISFTVWYDLNLGNLSVVLFALSAVIWRFNGQARLRGALASGALALAGLVRYPFGIVLIGWLAARRWRAVAWTIGIGAGFALLTVPVVGLPAWTQYATSILTLHDVSSGPNNLSLATTAQAIGLPGPQALWVATGMGIALVATIWAALRRDAETALVVSLAATVLFFPFFHPHYLVQLLIPAAFLAKRGQWWGLVLPLLGWLPGEVMAVVAVAATLLPLLPPGFAAIKLAGERPGAAMGFETGPTRP